jgi:hypothetical protein
MDVQGWNSSMMMLTMVMLSMKLMILTSIASLHGGTRYEILVSNPSVGSIVTKQLVIAQCELFLC